MRSLLITMAIALASSAALADQPDQNAGVAVTLTGGLAWVDMGQFSSATEAYFAQLETQVDGFERNGAVTTHMATTAGLRAQLRLPRMLVLETGVEVLHHRVSTPIGIDSARGSIGYRNTTIAVPLTFGVHAPIADRVAAFGSLGPTLLLRSRSSWDYNLGQISSFRSGVGGGFEASAGTELWLVRHLRVTAQLRYRFAKSGELEADGPELPPLAPVSELGWKGVGLELGIRVVF